MKIDSSLRPFEKKSFFLDLNGFPQEATLIKHLKLLGARHEPVFSKYVSFVVSNKVPLKATPATGNQRPYSPLTPKSNGMCPSPQLLSDCGMDYLDSSAYAISPSTDQNPPSPKVQSRGMALLKKATQKAKENQRATDLLEHCKRWNIKVHHVDKILSKVKKYVNLIAAQYSKKKEQKKKNANKKEKCAPDIKKLLPPFIKFEDSKRRFRPVYQEFTSWTNVIDSSLSRNINKLNKQFKKTGDLKDVAKSIFTEINLNVDGNLHRTDSPHATEKLTKSFTKLTDTLKPSNSTVHVSTVIHPMDREKEDSVQSIKNKRYHKRAKNLYCEICHKNYINLDEHINTEKHKKFMSNPINFLVVQDVVTSLPKKGDHLLFKSYISDESNNMSFSGDAGILSFDNTVFQPEIINTAYDPVLNINDLPTEPYSFLDPEIVSPSCSSPDVGPLPFLEDSVEMTVPKPLLSGNEKEESMLDLSSKKQSDLNQELPLSNISGFSQNMCLNITGNSINSDVIVKDLPPKDFTSSGNVNTLIKDSKCQEAPFLGNQMYIINNASLNVFAENLCVQSQSFNIAKPDLCTEPLVLNLSTCNQNDLPEESLNDVPEKENCDHDSLLKDEMNISVQPLVEIQPPNVEAEAVLDSVDTNIQNGIKSSVSRSKQKRRKVKSKSRNHSIKKMKVEITSSVQSCDFADNFCNNVSSVQNNLLTQSLSCVQREFLVSEETCDSQDSAIVIPSHDGYLKTVTALKNHSQKLYKSVTDALQICSEVEFAFKKMNPNDSTIKEILEKRGDMDTESYFESLPYSHTEIVSEETSDSQDSAIVEPLNNTDSTAIATLQNVAGNIPESSLKAFEICSETALAFEMVNPNDCKRRKSIESNTSDSDDLDYPDCHENFQYSAVDSGIDMPPLFKPSLLHSPLNSSFEKCAEKEAELAQHLGKNCSLISVNSCDSADSYRSSIDLPVQSYSDEKEVSINLVQNCPLEVSVNSCTSANCCSSCIDCNYECKNTSLHSEDECSFFSLNENDTSLNCINKDIPSFEVYNMEDPGLESSSAILTTTCPEEDKETVLEPVNVASCPADTSSDNFSIMPVISLYNKQNSVNNCSSKLVQISENEDNDSVKFLNENKECSLEIIHHAFDKEAVEINNPILTSVSCEKHSLIELKTSNLKNNVTDLVVKKNKSTKCTGRKQIQHTYTFLSESKQFSFIYGNKLQLLHISGIEFNECLFICGLSHYFAEYQEISAVGTPKLQECLISVDSTIKISSVKRNPACHSLDMLKEAYSKERWNLLLVKMEDLKLESGFIGLILAKCKGKALITLSSIGNKSSISKNFTTSPKPSSPVFVTIMFPNHDTTTDKFETNNACLSSFLSAPVNNSSQFTCDIRGKYQLSSKNETVKNSTVNYLEDVSSKTLVVSQPLNLSTKKSELTDKISLQTSTVIPQLNSCIIDTVNDSFSSFKSGFEYLFEGTSYEYERIAKQLNLASSNFQYVEPISVCSSTCKVDCCKPCTCDLGGGKCLPPTCNEFHYIETNSVDSSDNEWALPNEQVATKQNFHKFLSNSMSEINNTTHEIICEVPSTSDIRENTCLPQVCSNFQYAETSSMESSDNEWSLLNKVTPAQNLLFLNNPILDFSERTSEGINEEELREDEAYDNSTSPLYVVIDDADDDDYEWDIIKSEVDNVCRQFCDNECS